MAVKYNIEVAPAKPGVHAERILVGTTHDDRFVTVELQNREGETVELLLTQAQAFQLAGNIQGQAFLIRKGANE